ncbi:MAG: VanZ family protein [Ignavibacteria bacterium]|nr:VanZ family protein [Ignavibacteria bacterium]
MKFLRKYKYHIPVVLYCAAIFVQSSFPSIELPETDFEFSDKLLHLVVYLILFFLFFYSLNNQNKNIKLKEHALLFSLLFTMIYGASDEIHQYFVPNRECDFFDWLADAAGALLGLLILLVSTKWKLRKNTNIVILFLLVLFGCSGSSKENLSDEINVKVINVEAWYDLMPVVDKSKENFRFLIYTEVNLKVTDIKLRTDRLVIDDFNIEFQEYSVPDSKYSLEVLGDNTDTLSMRIYHDLNEFYVNKSKDLPKEVSFSFKVKYGSNYSKNISTKPVTIKKIY